MTDCVKCKHSLLPENNGHRTHLICAKVWLSELIGQVARSEVDRLSPRISAARDWEGLRGVAHDVGSVLISTGIATQKVHSDIADDVWSLFFQRWYEACIGSMPARDTFVLPRDARNGGYDRGREPRPNRSRRAPVSQPTR